MADPKPPPNALRSANDILQQFRSITPLLLSATSPLIYGQPNKEGNSEQ
jgi:hypothetical protein